MLNVAQAPFLVPMVLKEACGRDDGNRGEHKVTSPGIDCPAESGSIAIEGVAAESAKAPGMDAIRGMIIAMELSLFIQ